MSSDTADPFYWIRVIMASNRGVCISSVYECVVVCRCVYVCYSVGCVLLVFMSV